MCDPSMLISHKYKYIVFTYPKSGCSNVRILHLLLNTDNLEYVKDIEKLKEKHHDIGETLNKNKIIKYRNYYKVLIYRDPYNRFLSGYFNNFIGINSNYMNVNPKKEIKITPDINSIKMFIDKKTFNKNRHNMPQKLPCNKKFFNEIMDIKDIRSIFYNYDKVLNKEAVRIIEKYNTDLANRLEKEDVENIDFLRYDFYTDKIEFRKRNIVPSYNCILTEETKDYIKKNYPDDFYNLH